MAQRESDTAEAKQLDRKELLRLLDHTDSLIRWCSVNGPGGPRYARGANAMWAVAHRLAGNDEAADHLMAEHSLKEPAI
jgi:hypothetical protein